MKNQDYTALLLVDLLAAFDTINHQILRDRLKEWFGLGEDIPEWVGHLPQTLFPVSKNLINPPIR